MKNLNLSKLKSNIENRINADIESCRVGGCAVLVRQNGQIAYKNCFGTKVPGQNVPLTEDTLFRMASMTKPITAACILIQVGKGRLALDDEVEKYIPAYKNLKVCRVDENRQFVEIAPAERPIRIRDLLSHSSGIGTGATGDLFFGLMPKEERKTLETVVNYHADCPLDFQPGKAQFYSPVIGFDILARLVEITSGMTYDKFLAENLTGPLGMADTTFQPTDSQWERMVIMHNLADGKNVPVHSMDKSIFGDFPLTYFCGGAGLASTVTDYSRFAEMLLNDGKAPNGDIIIPANLIREMRTPQLDRSIMGDPQIWGLGVRVITNDTYKILPAGCFGWSGAYGTHFWVDPVNRITAVYVKNSCYDGGAGAVTANHFEEDVTTALE